MPGSDQQVQDSKATKEPRFQWEKTMTIFVLSCMGTLVAFSNIPNHIPRQAYFVKRSVDPIRIACVGDSLTLGAIGTKKGEDYPSQLQKMTGINFRVKNYGKNSVTAIRGIAPAYNETSEFQDSLEYESDIVLLMLGTNDAKFWSQHGNQFEKDMEWIVNTEKSSQSMPPRIIIAIPPWVKKDAYGIKNGDLVQNVIPEIKSFATKHQISIVDMYAITSGKDSFYINDNLHLNEVGYNAISNAWMNAILCDNNDICEPGEDMHTCPKDCRIK